MKLDEQGNFNPWVQPKYGMDANDQAVKAPKGYVLLEERVPILRGDKVFDVYAGWMPMDNYLADRKEWTRSHGRWTTFARKKKL